MGELDLRPGEGTSFLFVYPPTWYLVKRRDEERDARDTRYEIVALFGPDVWKGTGIRLGASVDLIYISWALILEDLHVCISMPPPHGCAVPSLIHLLSRVR